MPLSRYQVRNEYSLADPELYRAAEKDDPEALLEGVAMAGLVGVLRQLGDLAEFAAEIFHDLHEEVMVTASRGHSLMVRVQQLEAEFPTIEKAFLSQTNHSSFFYNSGLDWHPTMRMDQNLIARGDLPRFVMDSYEECRGPPRLFLLDKFDVAGAGACLKRYSDPSFFKVEPSSFGITGADVQREKKARKSKKKGSRWRNGETPDALPTSHAKLHQLFLEERIENGISDPAKRVRLKRRLNGFPFSSKSGKSYMEKFIKSPSPDHKEVHEIPVDSSTYECALEIAKVSAESPEKELDPRSISLSSSPAKEEIIPELFVDKRNEDPRGTRDPVVLQSDHDLELYDVSDSGAEAYNNPSTLQREDSEKEIAVDDGSKTDDSIDDYESDDIASEIDNYMDALTTMESEMDMDSEFKIKNNLHYLSSRREAKHLDSNDTQLEAHSSDTQSMGNSALSDDGNSSYKKEASSFSCSDTHSTAAENTPSDGDVSCNVFRSTEIHETEIISSQLDPRHGNEEHPQCDTPASAVLDGLSTEAAKIPSHTYKLGDQTAGLSYPYSDPSYRSEEAFTNESAPAVNDVNEADDVSCIVFLSTEIHETEIISSQLDPRHGNEEHPQCDTPASAVLDGLSTEAAKIPSHTYKLGDQTTGLSHPDSDPSYRSEEAFTNESALAVNDVNEADEIVRNPCPDVPHIPIVSEASEQKYSDPPQRLSGDDRHMDDSEGGDEDTSKIICETSDPSISSHSKNDFLLNELAQNQPVNELNDEGLNPDENIASMTNQDLNDDGPAQINLDLLSTLSTGNQPPDELHDEDQSLTENVPLGSYLSVSPSELRDGLADAVSAHLLPEKDMVNEDQNCITDGLSNMATEKKTDVRSEDAGHESGIDEDFHLPNSDDNPIGKQNPFMPLTDEQPLGQTHYLDAEPGVTISEIDEVSPSTKEIADNGTQREGTYSELAESLVTNAEVLAIRSVEEQTSCSGEVCFDEPSEGADGAQMSEAACSSTLSKMDSTAEPLLPADNRVDSEIDIDYVNAETAFAGPDNDAIDDGDGSFGDLKTLQVCDSGPEDDVKGLITEDACLSETSEEESSAAEDLRQQIISLQGSSSGFGQVAENNQSDSDSKILSDASGTYVLLEGKENVNMTTDNAIYSSFKQNELGSANIGDEVESPTNQLDQPHVLEANQEALTDLNQTQYEKHIDHVVPFCASFDSAPVDHPHEPSEREFSQGSNNINNSEPPTYPSGSLLSSFSPLPNASQIYADEMPPMPPLPPVQWRMTKFQHTSYAQERVFVQNRVNAFPPLFPSTANQHDQLVNQQLPQSALEDENSNPVSEQPRGQAVHVIPFVSQMPSVVHNGDLEDNTLPLKGMQYPGSLQLSGSDVEILQNDFQDERENEKSRLNSSSNLSPTDITSGCALGWSHEEFTEPSKQGAPETSLNQNKLVQSSTISEDNEVTSETTKLPPKMEYEQPEQATSATAHAVQLSNEKFITPLDQVAPETSTKEQELGNSSGHVEEHLESYGNNPSTAKTDSRAIANTENEQPQHNMSISGAKLAWPVGEENKPNGPRPVKLPRPRNPLIDAVAAHDKSKLRKVTERVKPQIQKEDERDSLLEQIRTKSFNLKPAVVTRPSIPGPTTNLRVAAILEKAKTIRQAFAGSDEDDDDNWSDS